MQSRPPESPLVHSLPVKRRVFGLDLLRAAAISGVLVAHASVLLYTHLPAWYGLVGHGGFYGVELFFVLSGFLIGQILIGEGEQLGTFRNVGLFYVRRWFRTLPLFFLFLAVNVWLETVVRHHSLTAIEVLEHGLFLRNLTGLHITFFLESWSLAVEEWFYLLFPAALWLGLKLQKRFDVAFLCAAALFFLFSTVARIHSAADPAAVWSSWQRMVVIFRFDALMCGIAAAWVAERFPLVWQRHRRLCAATGVLLLVAMYCNLWRIGEHGFDFGPDSFFERTFRFNIVSVGFALLLPWCSGWRLQRESPLSRSVRRIALWSYALYLVHLPLLALIRHYVLSEREPATGGAVLAFLLEIGTAVLLSAAIYRWFERPITRQRNRIAPRT
ncbi:MAG: acyltransferase [Verrucomicrobiota bacterium]|nr:acyltransferase [Verrucomicrobiota bacterium]